MTKQTINQMAREDATDLIYGSENKTPSTKLSPFAYCLWYVFFLSVYTLSKLQGNLKDQED